jgi:hypothetical protein
MKKHQQKNTSDKDKTFDEIKRDEHWPATIYELFQEGTVRMESKSGGKGIVSGVRNLEALL